MGGKDPYNLNGFDVCGVDRFGVSGLKLVPHTREDLLVCEPLSCCSPMASRLVLQKVKGIQDVVWLSCEGFEGKFMALLIAIEASHNQDG
jgi:hypothetical protein